MRYLALALLLAPVAAHAQEVEDKIVYVSGQDAEMNAAIAKGRATLPDFFAHFAKPGPGESGFSIKYDLLPEPDKTEYIWAQIVSHSPGVTVARLTNEPDDKRFSYGEKVTVADADIIDWGYFKDGVMQGNYSTRVLLQHLSKSEADDVRRAYGW